ncbi:hypothetical protein NZA98_06525, partial [Escherichia coli]|nr:hypothetical protein [Escherichia coli]
SPDLWVIWAFYDNVTHVCLKRFISDFRFRAEWLYEPKKQCLSGTCPKNAKTGEASFTGMTNSFCGSKRG